MKSEETEKDIIKEAIEDYKKEDYAFGKIEEEDIKANVKLLLSDKQVYTRIFDPELIRAVQCEKSFDTHNEAKKYFEDLVDKYELTKSDEPKKE